MVRLLGADVLSHAGYTVIEAADAAEALSALETGPKVSLLFTDINMPGQMDGLALARLVHLRWPNIRLLIVSGRPDLSRHEMPVGGRFIPKPYGIENMLLQVRQLLAVTPGYDLPKAS
jgi:CheY-like chemotaxis protein